MSKKKTQNETVVEKPVDAVTPEVKPEEKPAEVKKEEPAKSDNFFAKSNNFIDY